MIQSQINQNARLALSEVILLAKARKDLSFSQITE
ncbi:cyanate hydratase, partial [Thalassospira xiamenensis]